jgi:putative transposase
MILRAIKIRLYPNKAQQESLNNTLGCYRFVYNQCLALKNRTYEETKQSLGLCELSKHFHGVLLKQEEYSWLKEQNTKVMKQAIRQLLVAYKNFFEGRGYPKFKKKSDGQSALFPYDAISKSNTFEKKTISLTKPLKDIKFRCSNLIFERLQRYKNNIKSATLSKTKTNKYFLSVLVEMDKAELIRFQHTNRKVGIDLGVKDFVITSDGEVFENKHFNKVKKGKIARLQKRLSKKQKGSHNREKVRLRLAKAYEKATNRRIDYLHKIVNSLLTDYDYVFMENLNVNGMLKNHKIAYAIQELGLYSFKALLKGKALMNNKLVIEVDRFYPSSQLCHHCGCRYKGLRLSERQWHCLQCGNDLDRDKNAAINILDEGQRIIGSRTAEFTLVDYPTMDERSDYQSLKSGDRLKQEAKS